jgi:hypothetical protein
LTASLNDTLKSGVSVTDIYLSYPYKFLYGCESWSLTLREECRQRVFENKVLRRDEAQEG